MLMGIPEGCWSVGSVLVTHLHAASLPHIPDTNLHQHQQSLVRQPVSGCVMQCSLSPTVCLSSMQPNIGEGLEEICRLNLGKYAQQMGAAGQGSCTARVRLPSCHAV